MNIWEGDIVMRDMEEAIHALRLAADGKNELTANTYFRWQLHTTHPSVAEILMLFGSWQIALERAGIGHARLTFTKSEIIDALRQAREELHPFTSATYREWAQQKQAPSLTDIVHQFNSWQQALSEADILKERVQEMEQRIIESLLEAQGVLPVLTSQTYTKWAAGQNRPTVAKIARRYGSWSNALEIIGIEFPRKRWREEEVLDVLAEAARETEHLTIASYQRFSIGRDAPSIGVITALFGSWRNALLVLEAQRPS